MDKAPKPVSAIAPFGLRMQPALKAEIERLAKENARSVNAQIVHMLEDNLRDLQLEKAARYQFDPNHAAEAFGRRVEAAAKAASQQRDDVHLAGIPSSELEAMVTRAVQTGAKRAVEQAVNKDGVLDRMKTLIEWLDNHSIIEAKQKAEIEGHASDPQKSAPAAVKPPTKANPPLGAERPEKATERRFDFTKKSSTKK